MHPYKQFNSVAVLTCPTCAQQRWVDQEFVDLLGFVGSIDSPDLKVQKALPRHKPCNAIMHLRLLTEPERANEVTRTCDRLASALEKAKAPLEMVARARMGYYDDYLSPLDFPIRELVTDARKHKLTRIAERAMNGDFDAQRWESDAWRESPEGRETFKEFGKYLP